DFQRYSLQQGLPSNFVRTLLSDDESLWVGTRSGVTRWQKASNSFESLLLSNDQPMTEFVNALAKTPDGTLWVGTTNGLYALPSGETKLTSIFHLPDDPQSLSDNLISGLLVDANGQLWVDTRGGLNRLVSWHNKQVQFEAISAKAGKPGLYMGANLLSDKSDRLWTQWQVLDTKQWQFSKLTKADGVDIGTVWVGSYHKTRDGTLMYGGTTGLLMVHPERYAPWRYQPPIVISNLSIDGNSTPFVASKSISLPPEIRSFSIEFSALDFSAPQHNLYAYKLEGYDKDWNQTNAQHRVATYTNLDPGQYTLLIKGSNRAGQWSPHQLALMITQKPAWYETLWCRGLMWLLLATTLYFLYQRRVRYLQLKGARLQALVDKQTKELSIRNQKLDKANQELEQASLTDPLTGLKNRRFLNQVLTTDIATIKRLFNGPLASGEAIDPVALERAKLHFFLIDIDHFKSVNDTYGHAAGDQLLKQIPLKLEKVFRSSDYFIRWGGEEFLVVARQTDGASALLFAERLRQEIAENPFDVGNGVQLTSTISIGCASYPFTANPHDLVSWQDVVNIADKALYCAKKSGRNNWVRLRTDHDASSLSKQALLTEIGSLVQQGLVIAETSVTGSLVWD
ncbi:MAG: diguanylate cyclase, partial [Gammaproteobacteria bacterium]|nr:diguanylate cyclase [Gammaproteobacteria bacterium]